MMQQTTEVQASNATSPVRISPAYKEADSANAKASSYIPLTKRTISVLPSRWVPYAELMRIDRPAGLYAFYFPYLIGLAYASCVSGEVLSFQHVASLCILFLAWSVIFRGAACTWNDNIDQDFDRQVARCKSRPIARGAVTTSHGHLFTLAQCVALVPILTILPAGCTYHTVLMLVAFGLYPFAKRYTHYPQVVLGFPMAYPIFLCCAALHVDSLSPRLLLPTASLFVANILWTIGYDTVYAHQDIQDDIKAGVKSMAVRFADSTKLLVSILSFFQICLLGLVGWSAKMSPAYFVGSCAGTALALSSMLARVDLGKPSSCAWYFHQGFFVVGGCMVSGLFGEHIWRVLSN